MSSTLLIYMITSLAVYLLNHTPLNVPRMPFAMVPVRCWPGLSSLVTLIITCERIFNISSSVCHPKSSPALFLVSLSTTSIRKSSQTLFSPTAFPRLHREETRPGNSHSVHSCAAPGGQPQPSFLSRNVKDLLVTFLCFSSEQEAYST